MDGKLESEDSGVDPDSNSCGGREVWGLIGKDRERRNWRDGSRETLQLLTSPFQS